MDGARFGIACSRQYVFAKSRAERRRGSRPVRAAYVGGDQRRSSQRPSCGQRCDSGAARPPASAAPTCRSACGADPSGNLLLHLSQLRLERCRFRRSSATTALADSASSTNLDGSGVSPANVLADLDAQSPDYLERREFAAANRTQHAVIQKAHPGRDLARSEEVATVVGGWRAAPEPLSRRLDVSADSHLRLTRIDAYGSPGRPSFVATGASTVFRYRAGARESRPDATQGHRDPLGGTHGRGAATARGGSTKSPFCTMPRLIRTRSSQLLLGLPRGLTVHPAAAEDRGLVRTWRENARTPH